MEAEVDLPFRSVTITHNMTTDADDAAIKAVKADVNKFCALHKMVRAAGTEFDEVWNITRPRTDVIPSPYTPVGVTLTLTQRSRLRLTGLMRSQSSSRSSL